MNTNDAVRRFIEDAIAGGWNPWPDVWGRTPLIKVDTMRARFRNPVNGRLVSLIHHQILLDPEAWQAVGKMRNWDNGVESCTTKNCPDHTHWRQNWHRFIDALADGKTIEEALSVLN